MLSDQDRAVLARFEAHGTPSESRRARVVMMRAEGATTAEIAAAVALSESRVRYWTRAWNERGQAIFPDQSAASDDATQMESEPEPVPGVDMPRLPL